MNSEPGTVPDLAQMDRPAAAKHPFDQILATSRGPSERTKSRTPGPIRHTPNLQYPASGGIWAVSAGGWDRAHPAAGRTRPASGGPRPPGGQTPPGPMPRNRHYPTLDQTGRGFVANRDQNVHTIPGLQRPPGTSALPISPTTTHGPGGSPIPGILKMPVPEKQSPTQDIYGPGTGRLRRSTQPLRRHTSCGSQAPTGTAYNRPTRLLQETALPSLGHHHTTNRPGQSARATRGRPGSNPTAASTMHTRKNPPGANTPPKGIAAETANTRKPK